MRWPFISIRSHDLICATYEACLANERKLGAEERARAHARYADLMSRYALLRHEGHVEAVAPVVTPRPDIDPVSAAINRKAGGNVELRRAMSRQAATDRAAGVADAVIVDRINNGVQVDDEAFV